MRLFAPAAGRRLRHPWPCFPSTVVLVALTCIMDKLPSQWQRNTPRIFIMYAGGSEIP